MLDSTNLFLENDKKNLFFPYRSNKRRYWIVITALFIIIALAVLSMIMFEATGDINYLTKNVVVDNLLIKVTATGNLAPNNQINVGSELSGKIVSMTADFNEKVKKNQPLAYLDSSTYKAEVDKAKAEVALAEGNYKKAKATCEEKKKVLNRRLLTQKITKRKHPSIESLEKAKAELERAEAELYSAKAEIKIAKAKLLAKEADLKKTIIYAPIDGVILSREVEPGQTLTASLETPILYIIVDDLRHMELHVNLDEADVGQVKKGQQAFFAVDAYPDRKFEAKVKQIRYKADTISNVVTYKTILEVENPELMLKPGMTATADIIIKKIEKALLVPSSALRYRPEKKVSKDFLSEKNVLAGEFSDNDGNEQNPLLKNNRLVWVLEKNQPVPYEVEFIATDSFLTAVYSLSLKENMKVIIKEIDEDE